MYDCYLDYRYTIQCMYYIVLARLYMHVVIGMYM